MLDRVPGAHFAVGRCQHGRGGCQAAASFSQKSQIVSPDFPHEPDLDAWLAAKAKQPSARLCPSCRRPIGIQHFVRRTVPAILAESGQLAEPYRR